MSQRARVLALYGGEQEPPHSIEAEQAVLGGLLIDNVALDKVRDAVMDSDFYRDDHRRIFRHIAHLIERGEPADVVTVDESIKASEEKDKTGGITYLAALAGNTPSAHNVRRYAEMVAESAARRRGMAAALELHNRFARGDLEDARAEFSERVAALAPSPCSVPLDLPALAEREPVPPRHIVGGWMPAGEVTLLGAHGGAGKSLVALDLGASIALGRPWHGLPVEQRRVLYASAEDRTEVLHWRLDRVARHLGVDLRDLAGRLDVLDLSGADAELVRETREGLEITPLYSLIRALRPEVLILDGASDMYGASEIVRTDVRKFLRLVRALVPPTGAALVLAHVDKAAARGKESGDLYSGSTAWNNSVRSRWSLTSSDGRVVLRLAKANHALAGAEIALRWDEQAHLYVAEQPQGGLVASIEARQEREGVLAAMRACAAASIPVPAATQGPRTAYHVLRAQAAFPAALGGDSTANRRRFWASIEQLRASGAISEEVIRAPHRHNVRVLVVREGASR